VQSAEKTALTARELGARLPGIAALHADGTLAYAKARLIAETFEQLSDEDAAKAKAMILPQLTGTTGKTFGQIINLAARIANEVDPGLAERRRKAAVQHASRVRMFRLRERDHPRRGIQRLGRVPRRPDGPAPHHRLPRPDQRRDR
jgi:hypothetical protein